MDIELHPFTLPFARPLRGQTERRGLLVSLSAADGCVGWGEAAPYPGLSNESIEQVEAALGGWQQDPQLLQSCPSALHALRTALLDLEGQRTGLSLSQLLSPSPSSTVEVSHLVSDPLVAAAAVAAGARCLKMKLGGRPLEEDLGRIAAVRLAIGEDIAIRVDVNRGWSLDTAKTAMADLETLGVSLIEEPTENPEHMAALRCMGPAIAADESVRTAEALQAIIEAGWVDAVVLKPMLLGAPETAVEMGRAAAAAGLGVVVTTTVDTWVGRRTALHIAAAVPQDARLPCGLMTGAWLVGALAPDPEVVDGCVAVPTGPGLDLGEWQRP